ncbi:hypothetical protein [Leifsonia sp. LS-T14]|uniref:hypothetical protein n=1 Tax=unclassified Leifsonia TaxID=2663824 RepID=UPI0035A5E1A3
MSRPLLSRTRVWVRVRPGEVPVSRNEWIGLRDATAARVRALPVSRNRNRKHRRRTDRAA